MFDGAGAIRSPGVACRETFIMRLAVRRPATSAMSALALAAFLCCGPPASRGADNEAAPSVSVMLNAPDEMMGHGEYLLKLTDPQEQKQWKVLRDYVEVFLLGVDMRMPARVEVVFGDAE